MDSAVSVAIIAIAICGVLLLRRLFGHGEEKAEERMYQPHLSNEIELEKSYKRNIEFIYRRGIRLYMQTWLPLGSPKSVVLVLHGVKDHSGRGTLIYKILLEAGYVAAAIDQHGFGRSSGRHGYAPSIHDLADDAIGVLKLLKERFPGKSQFLLGGSMGGLIAVHAGLKMQELSEPLVNGLILHGPALHIHSDARPTWLVEMIGRILVVIAPKLPLLPSIEPGPAADGSPLNLPEFDVLYYSGRLHLGTALGIVTGIEEVSSKLQHLRIPFLALHGEADRIVDVQASKHLVSVAASNDKTLKLFPRGGHLLYAEPNFISEPFRQEIVAWLDARTRPASQ